WDAYLDEACGEDPVLRHRVHLLLRAHAEPNSLLDQPACALADTLDEPIREGPGTVLGRYKLIEQIGEGGFGVVFMAEQKEPVVKVIDFGIAKAISQPLTERTLVTGFAQMIGTPLYMSPEQVALSGLDVDTRSDVYSLGVLLYELLTGTTPFDKETLAQAGHD